MCKWKVIFWIARSNASALVRVSVSACPDVRRCGGRSGDAIDRNHRCCLRGEIYRSLSERYTSLLSRLAKLGTVWGPNSFALIHRFCSAMRFIRLHIRHTSSCRRVQVVLIRTLQSCTLFTSISFPAKCAIVVKPAGFAAETLCGTYN